MKPMKLMLGIAVLTLTMTAMAADGKVLYKKCIACHGKDGSKVALKVGKPLKGQKEADLYKKMKGYLDGTYGGKKKAIMKRNITKYSDDELKALAKFIATL